MSYSAPDPRQFGQRTITPSAPSERSGRRKAAHSKVRTGCDNCKQRRIKCDESRPSCLRCIRSDIHCKGYHPPEVKLFELNTDTSTYAPDRTEQELQGKVSQHRTPYDVSWKDSEPDCADTFQYAGKAESSRAIRSQTCSRRLGGSRRTTPPPESCTSPRHLALTRSRDDKLSSEPVTSTATTDPWTIIDPVYGANTSRFIRPHKIYNQSNSKGVQVQHLRPNTGQMNPSPQIWRCTDIETRGLHFFFEQTLPVLRVFSSSAETFFTSVVPQMMFHDPAIKHQLVALGLAHQRGLSLSNSGIWVNVAKNYGYALKSLATNPEIEPHILLSSCLLFLAIEMLCDGPISALNHLKSGLRMLRDEVIRKRSSASASAHISDYLEPIFAQLAATSSTAGALSIGRLAKLSPRSPDLSEDFKSLDEANMKFLELVQWTEYGGTSHNVSTSAAWQVWYQHLQSLRSRLHNEFSREQVQAKLLHAHFLMVQCRMEQRTTDDEMSWDLHVEDYCIQLDECFAVCVQTGFPAKYDTFGQDKLPGFDVPPGCFPPLWQVATVCRDPSVRRQAIELLRIHHQRVGHDDECYGVIAATAIMHLEENDLKKVNTSSDIPVHKRIRLHEVQPKPAGFLRCTISRWPFTDTESLLVPFKKTSSPRSAFVCSCKSFGIL